MACNENVIKNMATEIVRNCQAANKIEDTNFVIYLVELLLLNPKYGKLFAKTINRDNLEYFVNECVEMLTNVNTSLSTLRMQFVIRANYDKLQGLIDKHLDAIEKCLEPLLIEILNSDPEEDEAEYKKLFRKISIYIILCSGLGNPGNVQALKEGMAALESVFSFYDLRVFVSLSRTEKAAQLRELMEITSGVRLFNRDCKKGGEMIPDLPFSLVDAGKACLSALSNYLIVGMQRVNALTTAVEDSIIIDDETGNTLLNIPDKSEFTDQVHRQMFDLLAFSRQYEVFIRRLLADIEHIVQRSAVYVERAKGDLQEIHATVQYKSAVPVATIFPLFKKLWQVWRAMQNEMYLVSTINRLMTIISSLQEQIIIPQETVDKMQKGKRIITDQDRMTTRLSMAERLSLGTLMNYVAFTEQQQTADHSKRIQFLGFCALCLSQGALVPCNMRVGIIKHDGLMYGFCSAKMAVQFHKDPQRYVNEALEYARNHPHLINLLDIEEEVAKVKNVDCLVIRRVPKIKVSNKDIQTDVHPIEQHIQKDYSWDLWEWKRRACQWANIVNCQTHSTQTKYSHLRSEIQCQTVEPRDKSLQTMKETGINTCAEGVFLWGLRGQLGDGQHAMDLSEKHKTDKAKAQEFFHCSWPCVGSREVSAVWDMNWRYSDTETNL